MVKFASLPAKPTKLNTGNNLVNFDVTCVRDFWYDDIQDGFMKPFIYDATLDIDSYNARILPYVYTGEFAVLTFITDKPVLRIKFWNSVVRNVKLLGLGYLQIVQICQDWNDIYVIYKDGVDNIDMDMFCLYL